MPSSGQLMNLVFAGQHVLSQLDSALLSDNATATLTCLQSPHLSLSDVKGDNSTTYLSHLRSLREKEQMPLNRAQVQTSVTAANREADFEFQSMSLSLAYNEV